MAAAAGAKIRAEMTAEAGAAMAETPVGTDAEQMEAVVAAPWEAPCQEEAQ